MFYVISWFLIFYFYLKTLLRRLLVWWSAITDSLSRQEIACVFVTVWRYFMRIVSWFGSRVFRDGRVVSQTLTSVLAFPGQRATDDFRFSWRHRCQNRKRWLMVSHRTSATWSHPPLYNKDLFPRFPSYALVTTVRMIRYIMCIKKIKQEKEFSRFFFCFFFSVDISTATDRYHSLELSIFLLSFAFHTGTRFYLPCI